MRTDEADAMSNGPNRILDELARLMTDAAGAAHGVRKEMETAFRSQAERMLNSMDLRRDVVIGPVRIKVEPTVSALND
jgi:BMFP domain-containing protein YqiC